MVNSLTAANVREIYELLEPYALHKSMATMTAARVERLREPAGAVDQGREGRGFLDVRIAFYRELYNAGSNPQLVELIEALRSDPGRYLLGWRVHSITKDGHGSLIDHIARADADDAERWPRSHLEGRQAGRRTHCGGPYPQATGSGRRPQWLLVRWPGCLHR